MNELLPDTWASRELVILRAALKRMDDGDESPDLADVYRDSGLSMKQFIAGVNALDSADPPYLEAEWAGGWGGDDRPGGGYVVMLSERARRELGTWPSPDAMLERLIAALEGVSEGRTA